MIRKDGARWRAALMMSMACIKSLVNSLPGKRIANKQQMLWTLNHE
jgi:hypothetical protein